MKVFDSSTLSATADSLDDYIRQRLSRPALNDAYIKIGDIHESTLRGKLAVHVRRSGLTSQRERSDYRNGFLWTMGDLGPGKQFFQVDPNEMQTLLDRLCYILQRLEPISFPTGHARARFLLCIFNRLIRHANPAFKLKAVLKGDYALKIGPEGFLISLNLHHFDLQPTGVKNAATRMAFLVRNVSRKPVQVSFENRYMKLESTWLEQIEDSACSSRSLELQRLMTNSTEKAQFERAQRLLQRVLHVTEGFLGPEKHLLDFAAGMISAHCIRSFRGNHAHASHSLYGTHSGIWYIQSDRLTGGSKLRPST